MTSFLKDSRALVTPVSLVLGRNQNYSSLPDLTEVSGSWKKSIASEKATLSEPHSKLASSMNGQHAAQKGAGGWTGTPVKTLVFLIRPAVGRKAGQGGCLIQSPLAW